MYCRTFSVVFKPLKSNSVQLSGSYFRLISPHSGCLNLSYVDESVQVAWAPTAGSLLKDYEIGINPLVAAALGLREGAFVKCELVTELVSVYHVMVSTLCRKDWEILELSTVRLQNTLLDQARVVTRGQKIVVWLNRAISVTLKIDQLKPDISFGRLENDTELIIAPFLGAPVEHAKADINSHNKLTKSSTMAIVPRNGFAKKRAELNQSDSRKQHLHSLEEILKKDATKTFQFRAIPGTWSGAQMCDLYLTKHNLPDYLDINQVYVVQSADSREYYVNIKILGEAECFPHNVYQSIEVSPELMHHLKISEFECITLKPKHTVLNFIDRIELFPSERLSYSDGRQTEKTLKQHIIDTTQLFPLLLNQDQVIRIKDCVPLTVRLSPDTFRYCLIDADLLREGKIHVVDEVKPLPEKKSNNDAPDVGTLNTVTVSKFDRIIQTCLDRLKLNMCLDDRNRIQKRENVLLCGPSNSGKSSICNEILRQLSEKPFYCYFDIFFCSQNKGRKPESIHRDLRQIFTTCMSYSPAIVVLDNLDVLTKVTGENSTDNDYSNKLADIIQYMITEFTRAGNVAVIATVTNASSLNRKLYTTRGRHLFQHVIRIPELEKSDREHIIQSFCDRFRKGTILNWKYFGAQTEGYNIGDLAQLLERAVFYAFKQNASSALLTDKILSSSLKVTNSYCLRGIENHNHNQSDNGDNKVPEIARVPGLEAVVDVLEEVLLWPSQYPEIFEKSPLRNQAGVLLFGPPGTGKTYLVGRIARVWGLRIISVKGPELLAKYIGQSEENVRNLFDRARAAKPCVLFFDEFDSLAPRRGHDSTGVTDRVVNQLLTELDGVEGLQGVTVIGATSRPELIDPALLRSGRIDRLVECKLPSKATRQKIFETLTHNLHVDKSVDFGVLAEKTGTYTGADIQSVLTTANMSAVRECLAARPEVIPDIVTLNQQHLVEAVQNTRPSLSTNDILKYQQTYVRFTNKDTQSHDFVAKRATLA